MAEGAKQRWDSRFLDLAAHIAQWSKDPSTKVGAVIVRPNRTIVSLGYNGFPRGVEDVIANRDTKLLRTIHAELNAILTAPEPLNGCALYVWPLQPCAQCAAAIVQSGIAEVVCPAGKTLKRWKQSFEAAESLFGESGVELRYLA